MISTQYFNFEYDNSECPTPEDDAVSDYYAFGLAGVMALAVLGIHYGVKERQLPGHRQSTASSLTWACLLFSINLLILGGFQFDTDGTLIVLSLLIFAQLILRLVNAAIVETHWLEAPLRNITGMRYLEDNSSVVYSRDKYRNFTVDMVTITFLAFTQIVLIGMYVWAVFEAGRPCFEQSRIYFYYVMGIFTQVGYTLAKFYLLRFHRTYHYWRVILTSAKDNSGYLTYHCGNTSNGNHSHLHRIRTSEIWLRFFFSVLINEVGMVAVFALLPIQLANSADPMDFVMNCVAAYFIVELDDSDEVKITIAQDPTSDGTSIHEEHATKVAKVKDPDGRGNYSTFSS